MLKRFFHIITLLALCVGMFAFTPVAPAAASAESEGVSPKTLLNSDGSLKLDGNFRGALDLEGWNVQMDALLGPIFTPVAAMDNWAGSASGGGAFKNSINAIIVNGPDVYVGGYFLDAGGDPAADYIAMWDGSNWTSLSHNSGGGALSARVQAMWLYGFNLYVAGNFSAYDTSGALIANSAKLAVWNGSSWSALPGITSPIGSEVVSLGFDSTSHILYFGGNFTDVNGNGAADRIAGIDLDDSSLVTLGSNGAGDGSLNNFVSAIAVNTSGHVFAGGSFIDVNNGGTSLPEADRIAKWDGANWSALGNNGSGDGALTGAVRALAIDGSGNVYAGGEFGNAAGINEADMVAKWNGSSWSALGSNGAGNGALVNAGGGIYEIVINGSDIYVGGYFIGGSGAPTADYAARFDTGASAWHGLGNNGAGDGSLRGYVLGMAYSGGNLYVGGDFWDVNNGGASLPTADYFAIWDGSNWSTLGDSDGGLKQLVNDIAVIGTDVYVGGQFQNFSGDPRMDYLIRWDGSAWNPVGNLTQTNGAINSWVQTLAVDGTDLYVGGFFSSVQNEGVIVSGTGYIAKWDTLTETWSALGGGLNSSVFALAIDASHNIYAGGAFTDAASITEADYIAKWNGSAWSALAGNGSSNGALNGAIYALATNGANVYVGGDFTSVVNTSNVAISNTAYLAKWNGSTWSAMDGIVSPLNWSVYALTVSGNNLYVGGRFTELNGMDAADYIAKWDGVNWSALGNNGFGGGSLGSYVLAIAVQSNHVYVGGNFTSINNSGTTLHPADFVARWDGANWSALSHDGAGNGSLNSAVHALQIISNDLWVGGNFFNVSNGGAVIKEADYLAVFGADLTIPTVSSITRAEPSPSAAAALDFTVTFSESVTGVDTSDFIVTKTGSVSGATIGGLSGSGSSYTVTVNTGSGDGTIRLDLKSTGTGIKDTAGLNIGGGFTSGQVYTIKKSTLFKSDGANDGWILESTEISGVGGTMNSSTTTFNLGDDAAKKQYRAILHFDTSSLPDNATITKVTLKIKKQALVGTDPFTILGGLTVDMRKPSFGALALALTDFQSAAGRTAVAIFGTTPVANWYSAVLNASGKNYVNKTGTTQFRLRFATDDNNNAIADFMKFFSGNAASGARPQLIVEYKVP